MSEVLAAMPTKHAEISDLIKVDVLGRVHRPNGQFMSDHEASLVAGNQDLIRATADQSVVSPADLAADQFVIETAQKAPVTYTGPYTKSAKHETVSSRRSKITKIAAGIAIAAASLGSFFSQYNPDSASAKDSAPVTTQAPVENIAFSHIGHNAEHTAEQKAAKEAADKADAELKAAQEGRATAIEAKISAIGLKEASQFTEITDENAALPGEIEAGIYSMNHGVKAWEGRERTIAGSKIMSQDILTAAHGFTASDAEVAKAALAHAGVPQNVIDQLAAGDYTNLTLKTLAIDSPDYKNMTFNLNGQLKIDSLRTISSNKDVVHILGFKNADKFDAAAFRGDCGGTNTQSFESLVVETPATPQKAEEKKEEVKKVEKKEETTSTTVTTVPQSSTTVVTQPPSTTTSTPVSTTVTTRLVQPTTTTTVGPTSSTRPEVTVPAPPPIQGPGAGGDRDTDNNPDNNTGTSIAPRPVTPTPSTPATTGAPRPEGPSAPVTTIAPPANSTPPPSIVAASIRELPSQDGKPEGKVVIPTLLAFAFASAAITYRVRKAVNKISPNRF